MHLGPMTRSVGDAALMQNVMSGYHRDDHATVRERLRLSLTAPDMRGIKVAYSLDMGAHPLSEDVRTNTLEAIDRLRSLGARPQEVQLPWAANLFAKASSWGDLIYADQFLDAVELHPDLVCDYTRVFAERARKILTANVSRSDEDDWPSMVGVFTGARGP